MDAFALLLAFVAVVLAFVAWQEVKDLSRIVHTLRMELAELRIKRRESPPVSAPATTMPEPRVEAPPPPPGRGPAEPPPLPGWAPHPPVEPSWTPSAPGSRSAAAIPMAETQNEDEAVPTATEPPPEAEDRSWDEFVGAKLFAWLGGIALFLGAAFALQWSIQAGLIPPWLRVLAGFATAAGLVGGGCRLRARQGESTTSASLIGAGILVGYATSFAAHGLYRLPWYSPVVVFGVNALLTAVAVFLADRQRSRTAAWMGLIGGFATPVVLWRADVGLPSQHLFVGLLVLGVYLLAHRRRWFGLAVVACVGQLVFGLMSAESGAADGLLHLMAPALGAFLLPLAFIVTEHRRGEISAPWNVIWGAALFGALLRLVWVGQLGEFAFVSGSWIVVGALIAIEVVVGTLRAREAVSSQPGIWMRVGWFLWVGIHFQYDLHPVLVAIVAAALIRDACATLAQRRGLLDPAPLRWIDSVLPCLFLAGLMFDQKDLWNRHTIAIAGAGAIALASGLATLFLAPGLRRPLLLLAGWAVMARVVALEEQDLPALAAVLVATGALSIVASLGLIRRRAEGLDGWLLGALAGPVHYFLLRPLVGQLYPDWHDLTWPLLAAALYGGLLAVIARLVPSDHNERPALLAWYGGTLAAFLALAVPAGLGEDVRLAGWALQGAVFAGLARIRPEAWLRWTAVILLTGVTSFQLGQDLLGLAPRGGDAFGGPYLLNHLATLGALATVALTWRRAIQPEGEQLWPRAAVAAAALLTFVLLHLLWADLFHPVGRDLNLWIISTFAHGMAITMTWATSGILVLVLGLRRRIVPVRQLGVVLLLAALAKLFVFDLAGLGALPRIGAFMGVAALSLLASHLVTRASRSEEMKRD